MMDRIQRISFGSGEVGVAKMRQYFCPLRTSLYKNGNNTREKHNHWEQFIMMSTSGRDNVDSHKCAESLYVKCETGYNENSDGRTSDVQMEEGLYIAGKQ